MFNASEVPIRHRRGRTPPPSTENARTQGRYAEAEPLYQRALAIIDKALGPEHLSVAKGLENYDAPLRETGRDTEANGIEARSKAIRARHAGENAAD